MSKLSSFIASTVRSKARKPLVWVDCEMTGLDVHKDHIVEICCFVTDGDLNLVDDVGFESTVYYPQAALDAANPWSLHHHTASGLYAAVVANPHRTLARVQAELLAYIQRFVDPQKGLLAGNSVHMDKFFMMKEFPQVVDYLHYRIVDVSSIMEVCFRHNPQLMAVSPKKQKLHTARADILESIEQLRFFRENYLKSEEETKESVEKLREALDAERP